MVALAELVARLWETTPTFIHPDRDYTVARKVLSVVPRLKGNRPPLLIIAAHPGDLLSLADPTILLGRFSSVGAWIIDSFWDERIPFFARLGRTIDHVWVTDAELVDRYADVMKVPCGWAPWGSDVLGVNGMLRPGRDIDVLRLGRQPAVWEDDKENMRVLADHGLTYRGRFAAAPGGANQHLVRDHLLRSKIVLASGNLASPSSYTHPTRDYITARFADAVACGALIAGQPPTCKAAELIPESAKLVIEVASHDAGMHQLKAAVGAWTPAAARAIHARALTSVDWRHRIRQISGALNVSTATLTDELASLNEVIALSQPAKPREEINP